MRLSARNRLKGSVAETATAAIEASDVIVAVEG